MVAELNSIKGTMKLHSIAGIDSSFRMSRDTSSVCNECFTEEGFIWNDESKCEWKRDCTRKSEPIQIGTKSREHEKK